MAGHGSGLTRVAGVKGYSNPTIRRYLRERRFGAVGPTKVDEAPDPAFDRAAYRERNVVERLINRLRAMTADRDALREAGGQLPLLC